MTHAHGHSHGHSHSHGGHRECSTPPPPPGTVDLEALKREADLVIVALPHKFHIPYAKKAVEAGKNVLKMLTVQGQEVFHHQVRWLQQTTHFKALAVHGQHLHDDRHNLVLLLTVGVRHQKIVFDLVAHPLLQLRNGQMCAFTRNTGWPAIPRLTLRGRKLPRCSRWMD